jgi:putative transposase
MPTARESYPRYRSPIEIVSHAVWLSHRSTPSIRHIEGMLAERGVEVTCEFIGQWCIKFGPEHARKLRRRRGILRPYACVSHKRATSASTSPR